MIWKRQDSLREMRSVAGWWSDGRTQRAPENRWWSWGREWTTKTLLRSRVAGFGARSMWRRERRGRPQCLGDRMSLILVCAQEEELCGREHWIHVQIVWVRGEGCCLNLGSKSGRRWKFEGDECECSCLGRVEIERREESLSCNPGDTRLKPRSNDRVMIN